MATQNLSTSFCHLTATPRIPRWPPSLTPSPLLVRRKLPIGIQTFRKIRELDGYYYVDKTGFVIDLIEQGSCYFLSRPRRFGKSLLLDTLKDLFEGHQDFFSQQRPASHILCQFAHPRRYSSLDCPRGQDVRQIPLRIHDGYRQASGRRCTA